ncbi:hypothetical protein Tsubulata_043623, partial [Turnera subulata]
KATNPKIVAILVSTYVATTRVLHALHILKIVCVYIVLPTILGGFGIGIFTYFTNQIRRTNAANARLRNSTISAASPQPSQQEQTITMVAMIAPVPFAYRSIAARRQSDVYQNATVASMLIASMSGCETSDSANKSK